MPSSEIRRVAVIGTGVIGASWGRSLLSGGLVTAASDVERALAIYVALGKRRSYTAHGQEACRQSAASGAVGVAVHLRAQGVATAAYIDTAISEGLGLRWALMSRT